MSTPWGTHPSVKEAPAKASAAAPATVYDVVEQSQGQQQPSADPPHVADAKAAMFAAVQSGDAEKKAAARATLERLEAAGELGTPQVARPGPLSAEGAAIMDDLNARAAKLSAELGIGGRTDSYEVPQAYRHAVPADDPVLAAARATAMQSGISVKQWNALVGAVLAQGLGPKR
jgi:hypothetical protein